MLNESFLTITIVVALVYLVLKIVRDSEFYLSKLIRRSPYGLYRDPIYNKISVLLDELDSLEYRKKELKDAPNKLCNQGCTTRQKFLINLYEENNKFLSHIQAKLLIELNERLKKLWKKYQKYHEKLKKKYNIPDDETKWESKLIQYS